MTDYCEIVENVTPNYFVTESYHFMAEKLTTLQNYNFYNTEFL